MSKSTTPCPPSSSTLLDGSLPAQLHRAVKWLVDSPAWASFTPHGNTAWAFSELLLLTLFWVWSDVATLTGAFDHARNLARTLLGKVALTSYTGFAAALDRWTSQLRPRLWSALHERMESVAGTHWRIGGWLPLAIDGSRTSAPRTRANERGLCPRRYGRGVKAKSRVKWKNKRRRSKKLSHPVRPQVWLTLMWHMGLRMPWMWRCGPSNASERQHAADMLEAEEFPEKTLFCGDAGFVGHDLWNAMADRGHHFLIRVGANVRLLRGLGRVTRRGCDIVHFWPRDVARRNQPPMVLRLLKFRVGKCEMHAVTNVLSGRALSDAQAGAAEGLLQRPELHLHAPPRPIQPHAGAGGAGTGVVAGRLVAGAVAGGGGTDPGGDRAGADECERGVAGAPRCDGPGPAAGPETVVAGCDDGRLCPAASEAGAISQAIQGPPFGQASARGPGDGRRATQVQYTVWLSPLPHGVARWGEGGSRTG